MKKCLKFIDRKEFLSEIDSAKNISDLIEIGELKKFSHLDTDGEPVYTVMSGFHVNIICNGLTGIESFEVDVKTPLVKWA